MSRVEYLPEFGRAVRIAEFDRPMMSDDVETAQTVSYMDELASADADDPAVGIATAEALEDAGLTMSAAPIDIACAIYWWLKRTIRYVPTPGTSPLVDQTLITPCAVLAMPEPIGDCPQFSMLAAAMLRVCCINSLFVTIAAEPVFPDQWSHIYNTVEVFPGRFMPFDSSNGPEPGAEYAKPFKRRVWPRLVPGICRTKEGAKDMVRAVRQNAPRRGMRSASLRGALGDLYDDAGVDPTYTGTQLSTDPAPDLVNPALDLAALQQSQAASAGGSAWSGVLQTALSDAASIGTSLVRSSTQQTPYFITSPTGQSVLYNPNTGAVAGNATTLSSALNPTVVIIGLGLLGALALIGKK